MTLSCMIKRKRKKRADRIFDEGRRVIHREVDREMSKSKSIRKHESIIEQRQQEEEHGKINKNDNNCKNKNRNTATTTTKNEKKTGRNANCLEMFKTNIL